MKIRIGTRKSKLALAQTELVISEIKRAFPETETEVVCVTTKGDRVTDIPLEKLGGNGVFVKEIEQLLLDGRIDIAVHSAKDLPVKLASGLAVSGVLKRGNPRDMLILRNGAEIDEKAALNIGTGSLRRRQNLSFLYPNVRFSDIRGNVDTRLKKLADGEFDGIILACAGVERLGADLGGFRTICFDVEQFLPAACQAIIAVECRQNSPSERVVKAISDKDTMLCYETEKEVLRLLGADCGTPVSAYAQLHGSEITLTASLFPDKVLSESAAVSERFELVARIARGLK